ncbi:MAG TPA: hypothetical protein DDZ51_15430 [Planctomycetaceae bacterium]|nr:hypothetical protein [Planctomycetaceae bacterium]
MSEPGDGRRCLSAIIRGLPGDNKLGLQQIGTLVAKPSFWRSGCRNFNASSEADTPPTMQWRARKQPRGPAEATRLGGWLPWVTSQIVYAAERFVDPLSSFAEADRYNARDAAWGLHRSYDDLFLETCLVYGPCHIDQRPTHFKAIIRFRKGS